MYIKRQTCDYKTTFVRNKTTFVRNKTTFVRNKTTFVRNKTTNKKKRRGFRFFVVLIYYLCSKSFNIIYYGET